MPGHDSTEPVFVVGLPRSGTTLTERILSAHPAVYSAGELPNFGLLVRELAGSETVALLNRRLVRKAARIQPRCWASVTCTVHGPATGRVPHFVDKLPHNFSIWA